MCLILLSVHEHPSYKLIIAANRDEFYQRKTAAAGFWADHPEILGGRDLEAGGTWLGITRSGRISLLTNYRDLRNIKEDAPSRGHLVSGFLENTVAAKNYLEGVRKEAAHYNGFNILAGTVDGLWYYSNYGDLVSKVEGGIHGLSNHLLDTPWPKVREGRKRFELITSKKQVAADELFEFLYNDQVAPDDQLPDTGVGLERERALSAMFIKSPGYGSRSSTVILVDSDDNVLFSERVYDLTTFKYTTQAFEFKIGK